MDSIHPTWLARALQEESQAVRAAVAAYGPKAVGRLLNGGALPLPDRPPHPEVLRWVLSLWSERLVGGAERDDHPPVVAALTRTAPREAYRLWRSVGIVKKWLAGADGPQWVHDRLGFPGAETRTWAARDVDSTLRLGLTRPRAEGLLGLITAFRLLSECDPFVVRWALQRLPYPVVRLARGLTSTKARRSPAAVRLETLILETAWIRLHAEGRVRAEPIRTGRAEGEDER